MANWPLHAPPPPEAGGKTLRRAVIGVVVLAVIAAAVAVRMTMHQTPAQAASTASSTTSSSSLADVPAAGTVSSARLPESLPSATTLASLLIVENLVQVTDSDSVYTNTTTDRPDCGGAVNVGLPAAYDGSGYTAIRLQEYQSGSGERYDFTVTEAVSAFPSDQQAEAFVATEGEQWTKCKYKPVALIDSRVESFVRTILVPDTNAGVLSVSTLAKHDGGLGCQRALKAQRNIVIDVQICSPGRSALAPSLVAQIADRIPTT